MAALTAYLFCGATAPQQCTDTQPQPSHTGAEAAGIAIIGGVIVGTVVLIAVHHNHHNIKGCVIAGPTGLELKTLGESTQTYSLTGITAAAKIGDKVSIHGNKIKKTKDATGDQTFLIQELNKDYGHCQSLPTR